MSLAQFYLPGRVALSFELFPPKTSAGEESLYRHVAELMRLRPDYITCTYGAGGTTRDKTLEVVCEIKRRFGIPVASHLTCVGSTVTELRAYLTEAVNRKVDAIVALRGDPPRGDAEFRPVPGGLSHANELVAVIHAEFPQLGVAVAGYPEKHREAPSMELDLEHLRRKVDAGAEVVITQLFYDNADFFRFRDRCEHMGIRQPIVPGILPVTNLAQIERIASLCGARMPASFQARLRENEGEEWQYQVGVEQATDQVAELLRSGVPGIHFYVLNKSQATSAVLDGVGWQRSDD